MNETYIVHDKVTHRILHVYNKRQGWKDAIYQREWMARKALEKHLAKNPDQKAEDFVITPGSKFKDKTHMVRNLMSGKMVEESVNLPFACSVASEAYWQN